MGKEGLLALVVLGPTRASIEDIARSAIVKVVRKEED